MSSTTTSGIDGEGAAVTGRAEPAVTPEAGTEHLTGPEAPVTPEAVPVLAAAEPAKPWYRKVPRLAWAGITAVIAGGLTALILVLTVFSSSPATGAEALLAQDGYNGAVSISGSVLQNMLSGAGPDGKVIGPMVTAASAGFKGSNTELVFTLTPAGRQVVPGIIAAMTPTDMGQGVSMHMADGDRYWVADGPQSTLGGPSDYPANPTAS
jgi:hypothetical protein